MTIKIIQKKIFIILKLNEKIKNIKNNIFIKYSVINENIYIIMYLIHLKLLFIIVPYY